LNDLTDYIEEKEVFKACLLPFELAQQQTHGRVGFLADSFIKILLSIDSFQTQLIDILLEQLPKFYPVFEEDHDDDMSVIVFCNLN
jgi:hypothetical protein